MLDVVVLQDLIFQRLLQLKDPATDLCDELESCGTDSSKAINELECLEIQPP